MYNYNNIKTEIDKTIEQYKQGLITLHDTVKQIDEIIYVYTPYVSCYCADYFPDIDTRIKQQNRLYKYGLNAIMKAISNMERMQ